MVALLIGGYLWYRYNTDENRTIEITKETVIAEEYALTFSYPVGENGLTLIEPPIEGQPFKKAYLLIPDGEYEAFSQNPEASEAPAAVSVFIFDIPPAASSTPAAAPATTASPTSTTTDPNSRMARLETWARENSAITSFNFAKSAPETIEVDGVKFLHYKADGPYQQDVYMASYKRQAYLFIGQYNAETDRTYTALQEIIASISFD